MTQCIEIRTGHVTAGNLVSFYAWLDELRKTRATGHRWRRQYPWLNDGVVNIFGRLYIKRETIAEFERRALAGELHKEVHGALAKEAAQKQTGRTRQKMRPKFCYDWPRIYSAKSDCQSAGKATRMIVQPDFADHWKTELLVRLSGSESAVRCLIRFWSHCQNRKKWTSEGINPATLAAICKWMGDEQVFWNAMTQTFLDVNGTSVTAHEWDSVTLATHS